MRIIDLILLGKESLISAQNLLTELDIKSIFFEEPLDDEQDDRRYFALGSQKDIESAKTQQRRKFVSLKKSGNDTEQLYLVDANWVRRWIKYVNYSSSSFPGPIINDQLYLQLNQLNGSLLLGEDVFFVSRQIWEMLFSWYGGGPVLKWKIEIEEQSLFRPSSQSVSSKPYQVQRIGAFIFAYSSKQGRGGDEDSKQHTSTKKRQLENKFSSSTSNNNNNNPDMLGTIQDLKQQIEKINTEEKVKQPSRKLTSKGLSPNQGELLQYFPNFYIEKLLAGCGYLDQKTVACIAISTLYSYNNKFSHLSYILLILLQCIYAVESLREYYESMGYQKLKIPSPQSQGLVYTKIMNIFFQEVAKVSSKSGNREIRIFIESPLFLHRVIRTKYIRSAIEKEFSPIMEQDSHEFLHFLLNKLKEEQTDRDAKFPSESSGSAQKIWNAYTKQFPSLIDRLFTVIEQTNIQCQYCGKQVNYLHE